MDYITWPDLIQVRLLIAELLLVIDARNKRD